MTTRATSATASQQDVHSYFGLTYSTYLVLHRTLLQSMPKDWQHAFVALLEELDEAFAHVDRPDTYLVRPAVEEYVNALTDDAIRAAGIRREDNPDYTPNAGNDDEHDHGEEDHGEEDQDGPYCYYDAFGQPLDLDEFVLVPTGRDPIPPYQRGRARVEPDLPAVDELRRSRLAS